MPRMVALAGATGLVGREILQGLIGDPSVAAIHVFGRRAIDTGNPKVTAHVVDFRSPSPPAAW